MVEKGQRPHNEIYGPFCVSTKRRSLKEFDERTQKGLILVCRAAILCRVRYVKGTAFKDQQPSASQRLAWFLSAQHGPLWEQLFVVSWLGVKSEQYMPPSHCVCLWSLEFCYLVAGTWRKGEEGSQGPAEPSVSSPSQGRSRRSVAGRLAGQRWISWEPPFLALGLALSVVNCTWVYLLWSNVLRGFLCSPSIIYSYSLTYILDYIISLLLIL